MVVDNQSGDGILEASLPKVVNCPGKNACAKCAGAPAVERSGTAMGFGARIVRLQS